MSADSPRSPRSGRVGGGAIGHHPRRGRLAGPLTAVALAAAVSGCGGAAGGAGHRTAARSGSATPPPGLVDVRTVSVSTHVNGPDASGPQVPGWLPNGTPPSTRPLQASPAHPVRAAIEGNTVIAALPGAVGAATLVGPIVPFRYVHAVQSGHRSMQLPVPARFVLSVRVRRGVWRDPAAGFTVQSEDGVIHRPQVTLPDGRPLPARVPAGGEVNLRIVTSMVPGDGGVRWAPAGGRPLVIWTYVLEVD